MTEKKPKLVMVTWEDSVGACGRWEFVSDLIENAPKAFICRSVGWILFEDKKCVVVCPHVIEDNKQSSGHMVIPKCSIVSIRSLK